MHHSERGKKKSDKAEEVEGAKERNEKCSL